MIFLLFYSDIFAAFSAPLNWAKEKSIFLVFSSEVVPLYAAAVYPEVSALASSRPPKVLPFCSTTS